MTPRDGLLMTLDCVPPQMRETLAGMLRFHGARRSRSGGAVTNGSRTYGKGIDERSTTVDMRSTKRVDERRHGHIRITGNFLYEVCSMIVSLRGRWLAYPIVFSGKLAACIRHHSSGTSSEPYGTKGDHLAVTSS